MGVWTVTFRGLLRGRDGGVRRSGYARHHEEAASPPRDRRAGHRRCEEGARRLLRLGAGTPALALALTVVPHQSRFRAPGREDGAGGRHRSHNQRAASPAPTAATTAPPPTAAWRGAGIGTRSRNGTLRVNRRTSHPWSRAALS